MNLPNVCHPERSAGGKTGAAQSKDRAHFRAAPHSFAGVLRLRSAPAFPPRNSAQDDTVFDSIRITLTPSA